MGYLLNTVEHHRFDSEEIAKAYLEKRSKSNYYEITKSTIQKKVRKQKGEIIDEWVHLTLNLKITDEKEPDYSIPIYYGDEREDEEDGSED